MFLWVGRRSAIALVGMCAYTSQAEPLNDAAVDEATVPVVELRPAIDRVHAAMSRGILGTVNRVDSFFGDARLDDETQDSRIKLSPRLRFAESGRIDLETKFSARITLPALEDKVQLVVDDFIDDDVEFESSEVERSLRNGDSDDTTGLRLLLPGFRDIKMNADIGLRFKSDPQPYSGVRLSKFYDFSPWGMRLTEKIRWYEEDGWQSRSEMQWNRALNKNWLFRSSTRIKIEEQEPGPDWGQSLSTFKRLSANRALHYVVAAAGPTDPTFRVDDYLISAALRKKLHSNWLFMEVQPRAEFPRERDFKFTPAILIKLEFIFGKLPTRL